VIESSRIACASSAFFRCADASFNVRDMLIFAANVQFGSEVSSDSAAGAFEFNVSVDVGDAEPSFAADAAHCILSTVCPMSPFTVETCPGTADCPPCQRSSLAAFSSEWDVSTAHGLRR
jgi:hypothetical protein